MFLAKIDIQGFKTFAKKTTIDFFSSKKAHSGLTVIVGPNGSGKSNIADAIRWCLGEQSMKQLRGKKTEDIIFSGSAGKNRSGFAEVTLTLNNEDKALKLDFSEITITRRVYRDGDGAYLLNGKKCRLTDIQLLLAEAGIGQRTYTVVGQGMIDHVLKSSPEERKIFFDDATGVRGLQMKRHQSMLKLRKASENLSEVELLLSEIEPRLRSLKRQVKRLEKREVLEVELKEIQKRYYGYSWWHLQSQMEKVQIQMVNARQEVEKKRLELEAGDKKLAEFEQEEKSREVQSGRQKELQEEYRAAQKALNQARQSQFELERELELEKVKAQSNWAPLPLHEIIQELSQLEEDQKKLKKIIVEIQSLEEMDRISGQVDLIFDRSSRLRTRLTKPNPEDFKPSEEELNAIQDAKDLVKKRKDEIRDIEKRMDEVNKEEATDRTALFAFQRKLREIQKSLHQKEQWENEIKIEVARIETRLEGLQKEMAEEIADFVADIVQHPYEKEEKEPDQLRQRILQIKHELELIGGIDEETVQEYESTKERYDFLSGQLKDIHEAIKSTEKIVDELDETIKKQSDKAFKAINKEFQKYFKILFGGGSCSLIRLKGSDQSSEDEPSRVALDRAMEALAEKEIEENSESVEAIVRRIKKKKDYVAGIEIEATPPGKKLKSLNLLSGGERAMTSIALLSAIMATNPSPFVVLDEVDAALDESNTIRFANILHELQKLTQFIVITHNRATMERSDFLYGVTMGDDGISNILSVRFDDLDEQGTVRR